MATARARGPQRGAGGVLPVGRPLLAPHVVAVLAVVFSVACGGGAGDQGSSVDFSARAVGEAFDPEMQPVLLNSALATGRNRLAFGFFRSDGSLILDLSGAVRVYRLDGSRRGAFVSRHELERAALSSTTDHEHADGSTHVHDDELVAVFYAAVDFNGPGDWGAAFDLEIEGEARRIQAQPFTVLDRTPEPQIGEPLPDSPHLTLRHTGDLALVSSMLEPVAEMNELTVSEAVATGKPVLVAIATPAFCQSRFCGPLMEAVVVPLWREFGSEVQFVHIEPYILEAARTAGRLVPIPLMRDWGLQTEPWIFLAGRDGAITSKFEGVASIEEVRAAILGAIDAPAADAPGSGS